MADNKKAEEAQAKKVDYDFAAHEKPIFDEWVKEGYFHRSKGDGEHAD